MEEKEKVIKVLTDEILKLTENRKGYYQDKVIEILADEILELTEDCERYCQYKDADECDYTYCQDCIIKWAEKKAKEEMEENKNDKN